MKPRLTVIGAAGHMGRRIIALAHESGQFDIISAVDRGAHPDMGKDAGLLAGIQTLGVPLSDTCASEADVAIDFSLPEATDNTLRQCIESNIALVLGTTGLDGEQRTRVEKAAQKLPIVFATNMSVGMNVLFSIVGKVAAMLGDKYDIEIVEEHHRRKKDAPSGSALTLAEKICEATNRDFPGSLTHGRHGKDALRQEGTIGMHAIRAGDITGTHSVIYGTTGETLRLNHVAHNRDMFAQGALKAANWLVGKKPGLYSMADVLGIE